jgi:hypothetical protein
MVSLSNHEQIILRPASPELQRGEQAQDERGTLRPCLRFSGKDFFNLKTCLVKIVVYHLVIEFILMSQLFKGIFLTNLLNLSRVSSATGQAVLQFINGRGEDENGYCLFAIEFFQVQASDDIQVKNHVASF